MIYITSGHEKGVGLEIFFNSALHFGEQQLANFTLISEAETIKKYLSHYTQDFAIEKNAILFKGKRIPFINIGSIADNLTLDTLLHALSIIKEGDTLVTLPSSKDQFKYNGKDHLGYTEFLRSYYLRQLPMTFYSDNWHVALLTDHISLKEVIENLNNVRSLEERVTHSINGIEKFFYKLEEVIISGINPHAGENGLLGEEEKLFFGLINNLKVKYPHINFIGPKPADTIHLLKKSGKRQLFIYSFHDQGLAPFKLASGVRGINITHGLPFLRMSVDHGTAFDLFGKNKANYIGSYYVLEKALRIAKKGHL
jgi:4-hydroxythreonine-4-phosphate dehydrogenase